MEFIILVLLAAAVFNFLRPEGASLPPVVEEERGLPMLTLSSGEQVELTIDNPPSSLKPGYSFEGTIASDGDVEMLLIPQAAVTTGRGGLTTVQRLNDDGTTETVTVSVKYLGEGTCQLLAGSLQEGDILVYERQSGNPMMMMGF